MATGRTKAIRRPAEASSGAGLTAPPPCRTYKRCPDRGEARRVLGGASIRVQAIVERLEADPERLRGASLVAGEVRERRHDEAALGVGERRADLERRRGRLLGELDLRHT